MNHNKKIAFERIKILFEQAEENREKSKRYVTLARKISTKNKTSIPSSLKKRYCKNCNAYLIPGKNCRVRNHKGRMIYQCLECKTFKRFVIKKN